MVAVPTGQKRPELFVFFTTKLHVQMQAGTCHQKRRSHTPLEARAPPGPLWGDSKGHGQGVFPMILETCPLRKPRSSARGDPSHPAPYSAVPEPRGVRTLQRPQVHRVSGGPSRSEPACYSSCSLIALQNDALYSALLFFYKFQAFKKV